MFTILVTFLTVIADQITKYFVCINMDLGETIPVIKNVVHLTYIINPGAAFGLFPHQDVLFLGIVMILLLAFAWLRDRIPQKPVYFPLSIGLLLGGAVGNALDRCRIGGVVDFFDFRIWPIFNVADIAICIGVACIAFYFWRHDEYFKTSVQRITDPDHWRRYRKCGQYFTYGQTVRQPF